MAPGGGADGEALKERVRETVEAAIDVEVRVRFYERADTLDVHVVAEGLDEELAAAAGDATVNRYSDLKYTITGR